MEENEIYLSVISPIHNEEAHVVELYFRLSKALAQLDKPYEIIFVDDGSTDRTYALIKDLKLRDEKIKIVRFIRNFGQPLAVTAGFNQAKGKVVVSIEGSLKSPPEEIPHLLAELDKGYDVVIGSTGIHHVSIIYQPVIRIINWFVSKLTGITIQDYDCLLMAYKRGAVKMILQCRERSPFIRALVSWLGLKTSEIIIDMNKTHSSTKTVFDLLKTDFELITSFSVLPIRFLSSIGIFMGSLAIILGILWLIQSYISGISNMVMLAFLSITFGIQLYGLAFLSKYVAKIYLQIQGRPYYIIDEVIE
ncbi:MAG: glycosyltransferase family 2 protein [bacterium]|nr:glycosyltransferase family 2 protein [bacterium]